VIVDAVGVCEEDKTDMRPLERVKSVPFEKLLGRVAMGIRDVDTLTSLAGRLARLERGSSHQVRERIAQYAGGVQLKDMVHNLLDAVDPDVQLSAAERLFEDTSLEALVMAQDALVQKACAPFDSPALRDALADAQRQNEQVIDTESKDELLDAGFTAEQAQGKVESFRAFIEANKDELTALQILYSQPYGARRLTYGAVKELAGAIKLPPYNLTPEELWRAYERLDRSRVRGAGPSKLLTEVISLVRFALAQRETLEPFPLTVEERYRHWILDQEGPGGRSARSSWSGWG
jgi:type I restriction enzyme, R subunit